MLVKTGTYLLLITTLAQKRELHRVDGRRDRVGRFRCVVLRGDGCRFSDRTTHGKRHVESLLPVGPARFYTFSHELGQFSVEVCIGFGVALFLGTSHDDVLLVF